MSSTFDQAMDTILRPTVPRATIEGSLDVIWTDLFSTYTAFQQIVLREEIQAPGLGRVIARIGRNQSSRVNHHAMAVLFAAQRLIDLAGGAGSAQILGYGLDVYREHAGACRKISTFDALLRIRLAHAGMGKVEPGVYAVTVEYAEEPDKKRRETFTHLPEHKKGIELLRKKRFDIIGHILVRTSPLYRDRVPEILYEDGLTMVNMKLNIQVRRKKRGIDVIPKPGQEMIDAWCEGSKKSIESVLLDAGAVRRATKTEWYETLADVAIIVVKWLMAWVPYVRPGGRRKSISIYKLEKTWPRLSREQLLGLVKALAEYNSLSDAQLYREQLRCLIPEDLAEAPRLIEFLQDANNSTSWQVFYELVDRLPMDRQSMDDLWTTFGKKMMEEYLRGQCSKRRLTKFVRNLSDLQLLESLKQHVEKTDNEIMSDYFELSKSPEWNRCVILVRRSRWVARRILKQKRRLQKLMLRQNL